MRRLQRVGLWRNKDAVSPAPRVLFSPSGRRWPEGPDEGAETTDSSGAP